MPYKCRIPCNGSEEGWDPWGVVCIGGMKIEAVQIIRSHR